MGTICCPECHGYGTLEYRKVTSRCSPPKAKQPGLWVCGVCQGLGNIGDEAPKAPLKMTRYAIQQREAARKRYARQRGRAPE